VTLRRPTIGGLTKLFNFNSWQPERLRPCRVARFYRGGALIGRLHGIEEPDGDRPEEWVGSVTPAWGERDEGLSRLESGRLLRDAIAADPEGWLGERHVQRFGVTTGLLVKLLDSAERLPVHAHPDRAFASERLDSPFGKTEAWLVLGTRGASAEVWVGLREPVPRERWLGWIEEQDTQAMLGSLNHVMVRSGDVVYVPAGVPHAIGAGVLLAELQEPTDFSLLCEWRGFPIDAEASHLGLGWDTAADALDLEPHEPVRRLPGEARGFFFADSVAEPAGRFAVLLVLEGTGTIAGTQARAGDGFAVPAAATDFAVAGDMRVLRCLAPDP